jgi:hypothetical protein
MDRRDTRADPDLNNEGVDDLIAFLTARINEDEWWAREASRGLFEGEYTPTGEHWQWTDNYDGPAIVDPALSEYVHSERNGLDVVLCSVEKYNNRKAEWRNGDTRLVISGEEIPTAVGGHIARHDPARVLAEVEAKRAILAEHATMFRNIGWQDDDHEEVYEELEVCALCVSKHSHFSSRAAVPEGACKTVRILAAVYADHPDYHDEWRP